MLVQCRCGKKLQVKDTLIGKKVRCPTCQEVFIAKEPGDEKEGVVPDTSRHASRSGRAESEPIRKKKTAANLDDDFADDDRDESSQSSAKKPSRSGQGKTGVSLARTIVAVVLLCVLVVVAVVLYWRKTFTPGSVQLEVNLTQVDVFIDGKKVDFSVSKVGGLSLTIDLEPGTHEVRVSKDGFHPFTKEVTVKSEITEVIRVELRRIIGAPDLQAFKDFAGTWVVTYSNKVLRVYTVTRDGQATYEQTQKNYSLSLLGLRAEEVVMEAYPALERWQLAAGKLRIDHWNPRTRYPNQPPTETAVGEKKTPEELAEDARVLRSFQGKWKITYTNKTQREFTADAEGRLNDGRRLVRIKGHVLFDLNDRIERLTLEGNQLKVEHYYPYSKYLDDPANPQVRGTGVRE